MAQPKRRWWLYALGAIGTLLLACCLVTALWTEEKKFTVTRHRWARSVDIEQEQEREETLNCDRVRKGAREVKREWAEVRVNGELEQRFLCTIRYSEWVKTRTEKHEGEGVEVVDTQTLAAGERAGAREETYRLDFNGDDGKPYTCTLKESGWRKVKDGETITLTLSGVTGQPVCIELN